MTTKFPEFVKIIINTFEQAGFQIYIVGGAVRDILTNRDVNDWDFTTNATPDQILKLFPDGFYDNVFGTIGIAHESCLKPYEITTFRREIGFTDKRHPDKVEWGESLEEDLSRRDFTINAMALRRATLAQGKLSNLPFELIDPHGGQNDLKNKLIKAVGDPVERFREDALRVIRGVRIASELGFTIEEKTFEAIKMQGESVNLVSKERIRDELLKLLASLYPYEGVVMLRNSGLLTQILPEVEKSFGVKQKSPKRHHLYDVGTHLFMSLKNCPSKDPLVRLATLLHDIGKPQTQQVTEKGIITFYNHEVIGSRMAKEIADRLRLSKKQKDKLWTLIRYHQFTVDERQTDGALRRFIRKVGKDNLQDMLDLRTGDRLGGGASETSWRLEKFKKRLEEVQKQPFSVKDLEVDGNDVMKTLNIPSGPKIGQILSKLFAEVEEDLSKNNRDYLLKRIKEIGNNENTKV
ncbi:MAG: HD domain-containing protein [Candidatus Blackburnbacteria bacterium]|nr:HD domain-containing protein [Candidatus Blackburnbacteria bacterium]